MPRRRAAATAAVREPTSSLPKMLVRWLRTVPWPMKRASATSRSESPSATRRKMSRSRRVRPAADWLGWLLASQVSRLRCRDNGVGGLEPGVSLEGATRRVGGRERRFAEGRAGSRLGLVVAHSLGLVEPHAGALQLRINDAQQLGGGLRATDLDGHARQPGQRALQERIASLGVAGKTGAIVPRRLGKSPSATANSPR